jgi:hypothetical protein
MPIHTYTIMVSEVGSDQSIFIKDYGTLHERHSYQEMPYNCGTKLVKYLLCMFSCVFFVAEAVVVDILMWIASDRRPFIAFTQLLDNEELRTQFQQIT